jgi:hypothetical protein
VHVSEDIFGGMNVLSRGGTIDYVDYMQVDKGRDVQYDAALGFEGKISGGTAVHTLSRDFSRLMGSPLSFFHKVSLFSGAFGYFWSNLNLAICVLTLAALHGVVAVLPPETQFLIYSDTPSYVPLVNLGFVYLLALIVQFTNERGIKPTMYAILTVIAAIPLTISKLKCHQYYAHRGLALGIAKYVPTGRDLATKRFTFQNSFARYSISHFTPALDLMVLLLITARFNALGGDFYLKSTLALWVTAISWLLSPAIYNPFAFTLSGVKADLQEWTKWVHGEGFEDFFYGQKADSASGELNQNNWYSWLNAEPTGLKLCHSIAKLLIYGSITLLILRRVLYVPIIGVGSLSSAHGSLQVLAAASILLLMLYASRVDRGILRLLACYAFLIFILLSILLLSHWAVLDTMFSLSLCIYTLGKAACSLLELVLIACAAVPLWSDSWRSMPIKGAQSRSSSANLLLPRRCDLLAWAMPLSVGRLHAELQGAIFLCASAILSGLLSLPISVIVLGLLLVGIDHVAKILVGSTALADMQGLGYTAILLLLFCSAWVSLSGPRPRQRTKSVFSTLHFQLLTLRLHSLHDWLLMNGKLARSLAERAAQTKEA